jgi:acyl-CoA thioesterase
MVSTVHSYYLGSEDRSSSIMFVLQQLRSLRSLSTRRVVSGSVLPGDISAARTLWQSPFMTKPPLTTKSQLRYPKQLRFCIFSHPKWTSNVVKTAYGNGGRSRKMIESVHEMGNWIIV